MSNTVFAMVERIQPHEAKPWIMKKHYAHRMPCVTDAFGVYVDGNMCGVCTFGVPASPSLCVGVCGEEYKDFVRELNRLCVADDSPFQTSKFVGACLRLMKPSNEEGLILVSYADKAQGHIGKIYQATNWLYTGATKKRTDICTPDGKHSRHYDKGQDYTANRKTRSSKHRYIMFIGNKRWRKEAEKHLKYKVLPYPQGETKRYDASAKVDTQTLLFK